MEALGLNLGYLIVQILNFGILVVVLKAWVYDPIFNLLERRREAIAQGLEDARVAAEARENAEKEAEDVLNEAQVKASHTVREATERAEQQRREILTQAEAEASGRREEALQEVERERERILSEVRGQVAALAMAAAQKLIGESLDQQRQRALIDEFFSGVKSGKVVVLEGEKMAGASAVVTSALPLTEEEKASVKEDILSKIGDQATVTFRVDPAILGGLVVRVGDKVLDGSVAGRLEEMSQRLS
ncbi:MAG TPA: F0F1 ATP synthase subunit B [Anaerolineales bacterium]|jgi:F-type H+-transporting ATPase subunit b|nr:F0F1 ATP synthase subunit B [Anaerolineales bacterium]